MSQEFEKKKDEQGYQPKREAEIIRLSNGLLHKTSRSRRKGTLTEVMQFATELFF
jgi:hypothetical protein